jgi:hypothetical protein
MTLDALSFYLARPQVLPSSIVKSTSAALRLCRMKAERNIPLTTRAPFRSICLKHTPSGIAEAAPGQTRDGLSKVADAEPSTRRPRGLNVLMSLRPSPPHNGRNPRGQQRPWLLLRCPLSSARRPASRQPSFPRASRRSAAAPAAPAAGAVARDTAHCGVVVPARQQTEVVLADGSKPNQNVERRRALARAWLARTLYAPRWTRALFRARRQARRRGPRRGTTIGRARCFSSWPSTSGAGA